MNIGRKIRIAVRRGLAYAGMYFYLFRKSMGLSLAISLANFKQKAFNRRFFVILDERDRLVTLCNADVKRLKAKGCLSKHLTHLELLENSFYYTPVSRNNDSRISSAERQRKRRVYYRYMAARRKLAQGRAHGGKRFFQRKS